ncbi:CAP domain-containing protein [Mycena floridula]|nr:CAP domain-containing protein [Mycena floridula]
MAWTTLILFAILTVPGAIAGPACARKYYQTPDCIAICGSKWGYPGLMMGDSAWGWNEYISKACGLFTSTSASSAGPGVAGAVGSSPSSVTYSIAVPSANIDTLVPSSSSTFLSTATTTTTTSTQIPKSTATITSHKLVVSTTPVVTKTTEPSVPKTTPSIPAKKLVTTTSSAKTSTNTGSSSSFTPSSGGTSGSDIAAYLKGHNDARAQYGAKALTWSDDLASKAQSWADNCVFKHSGGSLGPFGENLAAGTGSNYGIAEGIQSWVNEAKNYNPDAPVASHFTQVVWKDTTQVGCAVQSCDGIFEASFGKAKFFVCEYNPPGNFNNDFSNNVQA